MSQDENQDQPDNKPAEPSEASESTEASSEETAPEQASEPAPAEDPRISSLEERDKDSGPRTPLRGLLLPDEDEDDDDIEAMRVRVLGSSPRADAEKRRTRVLMKGSAPVKKKANLEPDVGLEEQLMLYVLGELSKSERDTLRAKVNGDPAIEERLAVVRRHLEVHQSLPRVRPAAGSFLRLTKRMRSEGYLAYAYPGWHALWRRAFGVGLLVSLLLIFGLGLGALDLQAKSPTGVPFGSFLRNKDDGTRESRTISLDTALSTSNAGGYLWLSTPAQGVATEIAIDSSASFILQSKSELELSSGMLSAVHVKEEALYKRGFLISTAHGSLRARDASYSVEAQSGRTILNVARGRVWVQRRNASESHAVTAGMCAEMREGAAEPRLYPIVRIDIQAINNKKSAAVTLVNQSMHDIDLRTALFKDGEAYSCKIIKDWQRGEEEQLRYEGPFTLLPQVNGHRGPRFTQEGRVILESTGKADTYQFLMDFSAETLGWDAKDVSLSVDYHGEVRCSAFGTLTIPLRSQVRRLNYKGVVGGSED